jgi:hypothetical protein
MAFASLVTSIFLEFCGVFKYKWELDLSIVELFKMSTQITQKVFQISLNWVDWPRSLCVVE